MKKTSTRINRQRVVYEFTTDEIIGALEDAYHTIVLRPENSGVVKASQQVIIDATLQEPILKVILNYDQIVQAEEEKSTARPHPQPDPPDQTPQQTSERNS